MCAPVTLAQCVEWWVVHATQRPDLACPWRKKQRTPSRPDLAGPEGVTSRQHGPPRSLCTVVWPQHMHCRSQACGRQQLVWVAAPWFAGVPMQTTVPLPLPDHGDYQRVRRTAPSQPARHPCERTGIARERLARFFILCRLLPTTHIYQVHGGWEWRYHAPCTCRCVQGGWGWGWGGTGG